MSEPTVYEKALAFKEIEKRLTAAKKPVESEARQSFERNHEPGDRKTVWRNVDGRRVLLGDVSMDRPGDPVRAVTNDDLFEDWVTENHPDRIRTRTITVNEVDPEWRRHVLATGVDPDTGEILNPAGVEWTTPRRPAFRVNPDPGILEVLNGSLENLLELEGGES